MIDATYLKAHRTATSLLVERMARPGCKRRLGDGVISLHKRIRHVGLRPLPRWRSARPDPHKGAGLEGHF
jgi:hypothetical protein